MVSSTSTTKIGNCAPVAKEAGVKENEQIWMGYSQEYREWLEWNRSVGRSELEGEEA